MKWILYFVLFGSIAGSIFFASPPAIYWATYAAFVVGGIKIIDGDSIDQLERLLAVTNAFFFLKALTLAVFWLTEISYGPTLGSLYPWSIGISAVFTAICLIFGYIARYNMSKEAEQLRRLEELRPPLSQPEE